MVDILPGTEVHARGLRWEVVLSERLGSQTLYRLRGLEDPLRGDEFDLLSPFEKIDPISYELRPELAAPLSNWLVYHQAFLLEQALGPDAFLAVQPGRLQLEPYQLVPILRAIRMSRIRLLLADGVGLGKTIQAGLILAELMARRVAHRVLIVSPAGPLLDQWKLEMSERFGLRFDEINRTRMQEVTRSTELGANPFDHIPLGLVSLDYLKQEKILEQLERSSYDVVIIDEAHHCMDLGPAQERDDSQRRRLAEVLARRCDTLLLLTATPHDGNDQSFASLCELLDPSLVDGHGQLRGERYRSHIVRRLKHHIVDPQSGAPKFRNRVVLPEPVHVSPTAHRAFMDLQRGLLDLIAPQLKRAFRNRQYNDVLAFIALLKRSVSTVSACKQTLRAVADRFQRLLLEAAENQDSRRQRIKALVDYQRKRERFGALSEAEEQEHTSLETEDLAQRLVALQRETRTGSRSLSRVSTIIEELDGLIELAEAAENDDPKLQQIVADIKAIRSQEPRASILIYTEYVDSQNAVGAALNAAGIGGVSLMNGSASDAERARITEEFRTQDNRILISTDAAAEGLNLHQRCHHLIHVELPFNPNRLEQRNGRIDRFGQDHDPIVRYLYLRGTFEERILLRLIAKYERQRRILTFVPNTLGLTSTNAMSTGRLLGGILESEDQLFQNEELPLTFEAIADDDHGLGDETQALLQEVDRSLRDFQDATRTHTWLGDMGMYADDKSVSEASQARERGQRVSVVDLAVFVQNAVRLSGGTVNPSLDQAVFELRLPSDWQHGLNDVPGYDSNTMTMRLTTNIDITRDVRNQPVGFLGRSHPLVRKAIDRVRHLTFGDASGAIQDPRVSVVKGDVSAPTLLFTFLGRVSSSAGRELEQVIAVRVQASGTSEFYESFDQWRGLADSSRAMRTTDIYQAHFATWFAQAQQRAHQEATEQFNPRGETFIAARKKSLEQECSRQDEWLQQRAREITAGQQEQPQQIDIFGMAPSANPTTFSPAWSSLSDPVDQLAGFAADTGQPPRLRSEADSILRIYRQRMAALQTQLDIGSPETRLLGVLMIVPSEQR
jgi:superfamily II DNA or RNA helicase